MIVTYSEFVRLTDEEKLDILDNTAWNLTIMGFVEGRITSLWQCKLCKGLLLEDYEYCLDCTDTIRYNSIDDT